jgi:competence protein ComEC
MDWFKIILVLGIGFVVYQLFFATNPIPFFDQFKTHPVIPVQNNTEPPPIDQPINTLPPPVNETLPQVYDYLEMSFIDVGQGDSILISYPSDLQILVDAGNRYEGTKVVNYLLSRNITKIHTVVATHNDADHIGGLIKVFQTFTVERFMYSNSSCDTLTCDELMRIVNRSNTTKINAYTGISYYVDNYTRTQIFNPVLPHINDDDRNSNSIVLKVTFKDNSFLLTGDCDFDCENEMMSAYKNLDSDLLKVAHHGSSGSSSDEFIKAVSPVISIISVGTNQYGHPSIDTMKRIIDSKIYRTDEYGTIITRSDGEKLEVIV